VKKYPKQQKEIKQNGIGHTMRKNCILMHITEGKTKIKTEEKETR